MEFVVLALVLVALLMLFLLAEFIWVFKDSFELTLPFFAYVCDFLSIDLYIHSFIHLFYLYQSTHAGSDSKCPKCITG